ncbi:hypothetical protein D3C73_1402470 [compost metagenome]
MEILQRGERTFDITQCLDFVAFSADSRVPLCLLEWTRDIGFSDHAARRPHGCAGRVHCP